MGIRYWLGVVWLIESWVFFEFSIGRVRRYVCLRVRSRREVESEGEKVRRVKRGRWKDGVSRGRGLGVCLEC